MLENTSTNVNTQVSTESTEGRTESRRSFIQRSSVVAAGTAALVATSGTAGARTSAANILPTLYSGWNARNFQSILNHENAHVAFLLQALGGSAFPEPQFVNLTRSTAHDFANVAQTFENTGTATYRGAAPLIFDRGILAAAASIALVEARHSGYLNTLQNSPIDASVVPGSAGDEAFESPLTPMQTAQSIAPFLANPAQGMALAAAISTTPSAANDVAILRFALALEYLERRFYTINVPRFLHVMS